MGKDKLYFHRKVLPWIMGGIVGLSVAVPLGYNFLRKAGLVQESPVVNLEGKVFAESHSEAGCSRREYYFSIDGGKTLIRVIDYLVNADARISPGSLVKVKAREESQNNYWTRNEDIQVYGPD